MIPRPRYDPRKRESEECKKSEEIAEEKCVKAECKPCWESAMEASPPCDQYFEGAQCWAACEQAIRAFQRACGDLSLPFRGLTPGEAMANQFFCEYAYSKCLDNEGGPPEPERPKQPPGRRKNPVPPAPTPTPIHGHGAS